MKERQYAEKMSFPPSIYPFPLSPVTAAEAYNTSVHSKLPHTAVVQRQQNVEEKQRHPLHLNPQTKKKNPNNGKLQACRTN